jgi:hypothetical protein
VKKGRVAKKKKATRVAKAPKAAAAAAVADDAVAEAAEKREEEAAEEEKEEVDVKVEPKVEEEEEEEEVKAEDEGEKMEVEGKVEEEEEEAKEEEAGGGEKMDVDVKVEEEEEEAGGEEVNVDVKVEAEEQADEAQAAPAVAPAASSSSSSSGIDYSGIPNAATIKLIKEKNERRRGEELPPDNVRHRTPEGCTWKSGYNLGPTAASLHIPYQKAVVGFRKFRRHYYPEYSGIVIWSKDNEDFDYGLRYREFKKNPNSDPAYRAARQAKLDAAAEKRVLADCKAGGRLPPGSEDKAWITDYFARHGITQRHQVGRALIRLAFEVFLAPEPPADFSALDEIRTKLVESAPAVAPYCDLLQLPAEDGHAFAAVAGVEPLGVSLCSTTHSALDSGLAELEKDESVVARLVVRATSVRVDEAKRRVAMPPTEEMLVWPTDRPLAPGDASPADAIRRVVRGAPDIFAVDEQRRLVSLCGVHDEPGITMARRVADVTAELVALGLPTEAAEHPHFTKIADFVRGVGDPQVCDLLDLPTMTVPMLKSIAQARNLKPVPSKRQALLEVLAATSPATEEEEVYRARLQAAIQAETERVRAWADRAEEIRAELANADLAHLTNSLLLDNEVLRLYAERGGRPDFAMAEVHRYVDRVRREALLAAMAEAGHPETFRSVRVNLFLYPEEDDERQCLVTSYDMATGYIDGMISHTNPGSTQLVVQAVVQKYTEQLRAWRERMSLYQSRITAYLNHIYERLPPLRRLQDSSSKVYREDEIPWEFRYLVVQQAQKAAEATPGTRVDIPLDVIQYARQWSMLREGFFRETGRELPPEPVCLPKESRGAKWVNTSYPALSLVSPKSDPFSQLPPRALREICTRLRTMAVPYWYRDANAPREVGGALSLAFVIPSLPGYLQPIPRDELIDRIAASIVSYSGTVDKFEPIHYTRRWHGDLDQQVLLIGKATRATFLRRNKKKIAKAVELLQQKGK